MKRTTINLLARLFSWASANTANRLCFAAVVAVLVFFGYAQYSIEKEAHACAACRAQLLQLHNALTAYHERYRQFPTNIVDSATGKHMHSWRVMLLPWLGFENTFEQIRFDEAWDSPHNRALCNGLDVQYVCPSLRDRSPRTAELSYRTFELRDFNCNTNNSSQVKAFNSDPCQGPDRIVFYESCESAQLWYEPDIESGEINRSSTTMGPISRRVSSLHKDCAFVLMASGNVVCARKEEFVSNDNIDKSQPTKSRVHE